MTPIRLFLAITLCAAASLYAEPREFTILGGERILCEANGQEPVPAEKDGIKLCMPAFVARKGEFALQFALNTSLPIAHLLVEDVSAKNAVVLLEDSAPQIKDGYWMEVTAPVALTKQSLPWIFENGATTRVFRFTIATTHKDKPTVLYQPVVWQPKAKKYLRKLAQ